VRAACDMIFYVYDYYSYGGVDPICTHETWLTILAATGGKKGEGGGRGQCLGNKDMATMLPITNICKTVNVVHMRIL
jgi:hypothetical protein